MKEKLLPQIVLNRLRSLWADEKKRTYLLLAAGLAGMLLICLSEWIPEKTSSSGTPTAERSIAEPEPSTDYAAGLEERLTELISQMEGAGRTRVMVTLASGGTTQYAQDTEETADGTRYQHVLLGDSALVERVQSPEILGVAVVCEGAQDPGLQLAITELVQALTDVGASHITVTKMIATK